MTEASLVEPNKAPAINADELVRQWVKAREVDPSVAELSRAVMAEFGGPAALAREIHETYANAPDGGQTKALLLKAAIELVKATGAKAGGDDPLDGLSLDEMAAVIKRLQRNDG